MMLGLSTNPPRSAIAHNDGVKRPIGPQPKPTPAKPAVPGRTLAYFQWVGLVVCRRRYSVAYRRLKIDQRIHRLSRVVISLRVSQHPRLAERLADALRMLAAPMGIGARALLGREHKLGIFEGEHFQDFVWREMFARTLPVADMPAVVKARMRIARVPWNLTHSMALLTHKLGHAVYPRIDTPNFDVMIAETP